MSQTKGRNIASGPVRLRPIGPRNKALHDSNIFVQPLHFSDRKLIKKGVKEAVKLRKADRAVSETQTSFKFQRQNNGSVETERTCVSSHNLPTVIGESGWGGNVCNQDWVSLTRGSNSKAEKVPVWTSTSLASLTRNVAPGKNTGRDGRVQKPSLSRLSTNSDMNNKGDLSLGQQKKLQWAKEREELSGLWSPWGRPSASHGSKSSGSLYGSEPSNPLTSSYLSKLGLQPQTTSDALHSQSDCYLPPIKGTLALVQERHEVEEERSRRWGIRKKDESENTTNNNKSSNDGTGFVGSRRSSLPAKQSSDGAGEMGGFDWKRQEGHWGQMSESYNEDERRRSYLEEPEVTYYQTTSAFPGDSNPHYHQHQQTHLNNTATGGDQRLREESSGGHFIFADQSNHSSTTGNKSPRIIHHKILMDGSTVDLNPIQIQSSSSIISNPYGKLEELKSRYGGSTGYLSTASNHSIKPPPVAMRSSLTIGLDSPFSNSYDEIQKKEKEEWLNELEKQREEQRLRKVMEKEDKRARWGDRGIGVGHFWEPSDSLTARLPPTPNSRDGRGDERRTSPTPPAWLERSLTLQMQNSKSQPNLHQQFTSNEINAGTFYNNQTTPDLRNTGRISAENGESSDRTFIRGQNVPIDPDLVAENEKKRQANQEHLEAIKEQIAERQRKLKEERERQIAEDNEQERIMAHQRELELKRLDMEKRKRSSHSEDFNQESSDIAVESYESGNGYRTIQSHRNQDLGDEPPLIPHQLIRKSDAYEMEIARRQSVLLSSSTEDSQKRIGSASLTDLRDNLNSAKSIQINQSLMTDSDHLYERTLTPTKVRSQSQDRQREFGTQTELSDTGLTSDKSSAKSRSHNSLSDGKSVSKDSRSRNKPEDKPRWGSNPVKKQYLKQSEKDPNYQQRMKRRQGRQLLVDGETGTDESEDQNIPFPRIRSRIKSKSPTKSKSQGPLKALHFKTEKSSSSLQTKSKETFRQKSLTQKSTLIKNFKSDSQLNKETTSLNGIVRRNLGSIGGLNSAGASEESQSGSGFTSPSLFQRNTLSGSGSGSLRSHPSPEIPEYVPAFSSEFVLQRDFDELPINAGKIAPGFHKAFGGTSESPELPGNEKPKTGQIVQRESSKISSTSKMSSTKKSIVSSTGTETKSKKLVKKNPRNPPIPAKTVEKEVEEISLPDIKSDQIDRIASPPVPALLKKMQMGFHADESGRMSSLTPELLSPIPNVPIGSRLNTPIQSRLSSAAPKIDIDIAVCSASNPDLQRILEESEGQRDTTAEDTDSSTNYKEFKLPYIAPEIISSRSTRDGHLSVSRPGTKGSDLSMQIQEDFILDLMSQREVQEQLSARESELSEKGIIEFNIRLPSSWALNGSDNRHNHLQNYQDNNNNFRRGSEDEYRDPLLTSDRRKATADWLRRMDQNPKQAILTNLSSLKQGIRLQQKELDFNEIRPNMAYAISTEGD